MFRKLKENKFLFSELVKRDFKKKYKRTYLGMLWSVLSPLLMLFVMRTVFINFFGRHVEHYTTFIFCGSIVFSFFSDAAAGGMDSLLANSDIFSKVNVPKYMFLFSRNISALINFALTFFVFIAFCIFDKITFTPKFFLLIIPIICLIIFNMGMGLILSALYMMFRDMKYLWNIFITILNYLSVIFYPITVIPEQAQKFFMLNPIYVYISYFREIVLDAQIPSLEHHLLAFGFAALFFGIGSLMYKKLNHKFLYYV